MRDSRGGLGLEGVDLESTACLTVLRGGSPQSGACPTPCLTRLWGRPARQPRLCAYGRNSMGAASCGVSLPADRRLQRQLSQSTGRGPRNRVRVLAPPRARSTLSPSVCSMATGTPDFLGADLVHAALQGQPPSHTRLWFLVLVSISKALLASLCDVTANRVSPAERHLA